MNIAERVFLVYTLPMSKAFTLIELLVVITIIAVLASMLIPTIALVRDQAKSTMCRNNLRQQGLAVLAFPTDNGGILPAAMRDWNNMGGWGADRGSIWQILREGGFLADPEDAQSDYQLWRHKWLRCPAGMRQDDGGATVHYSASSSLLGTVADANQLPQALVRRPSQLIVIADVATSSFSWWPTWFTPESWWPASPNGTYIGWSAPHRSSTNWLLMDGHVENAAYAGTYHDTRFAAINQSWMYGKPVNSNETGSPTGAQYFWSRDQMKNIQ